MRIIQASKKALRKVLMHAGNIYFWVILGSFVVAFLGGSILSSHRSHADSDAEAKYNYDDSYIPSPFVDGFAAAFCLVGFWGFLHLHYEQKYPKWSGKLRAPVMDYESGQLVMPTSCVAEGQKWPWVACVREIKTGRIATVKLEAQIPRHIDLNYAEDIHIVPYKMAENSRCFGEHVFKRTCYCCPEVMEQVHGRTFVWHFEKQRTEHDANKIQNASE